MTALTTDRHVNGENHPYGVRVGDRVWFWPEGAPPLSDEYVKPDCKPALVLAFRSGPVPWGSGFQVWLADLVYVDDKGSARLVTGVPQVESSASGMDRQRSYGVPASWHRDVIHDGE